MDIETPIVKTSTEMSPVEITPWQDNTRLYREINLPIARIKKIMKEGNPIGMISADAPVLLAKACELFIMELAKRSWDFTINSRRRTMQKHDVIYAACNNEIYDFLLDIFTPIEIEARIKLYAVPPKQLIPCPVEQNTFINEKTDEYAQPNAMIDNSIARYYYPD